MKDDRLTMMRVFAAVAETGSFTQAAQSLGASQPFVSQTVARLEDRLGLRLLDRTTRALALTAEGRRYLEGAQAAIAAVDAAEAELHGEGGRLDGTLRVTAPIAFGMDRVRPTLPAFLEAHPGLAVELLLSDNHLDLIGERIDVAVRMGRLPDSTLVSRKLCDLRRVLVAAPALLARHGPVRTPHDLTGIPVLCWTGRREGLNRWRFDLADGPWTFHAEGRFRSDEGMSLFAMCLDGLGAMRCAEHLARPAIERGALVELLPEHGPFDDGAIYAVTLPGPRAARTRAFLDHMVASFRKVGW
ncbi:LysR family transcriptional regulator [Jannaschia sp. LMIT008]|uniref:LysR family transcriptional regulator n=1 Tax=Jannaschia maritima TaxID=3032585 RepID=UPI00281200D8|nr:LysR family transcriptional regulator [Jannaschia sp. LMIT008]